MYFIGALGETGTEVEWGLQTLFHLAQTWDCVLILDEADVFLAERTLQDIGRNGIVSGERLIFGMWRVANNI